MSAEESTGGPTKALPSRSIYAFTSKMHNDTYPEIHPSLSPHANHSVLITGSNRGVGRAMILSYARAGASRLALCSRQPSCPAVAAEIRAAAAEAGHPEPAVLELQLDVTSQADVDAAAKAVEEAWGGLDILINNAGYMPVDCFEGVDKAGWDEYEKAWQVNFFGTLRVTKGFLGVLMKGTEKTVLNSVSVGALYTTGGGESYAMAKFVLCRATEFWCDGLKDQGLLAYAFHPGGIMTELASRLPKHFYPLLQDKEELAGDSVVYLTAERREWLAGRFVNCNWDLPEVVSMEKQIVEQDWLKFKLSGLAM